MEYDADREVQIIALFKYYAFTTVMHDHVFATDNEGEIGGINGDIICINHINTWMHFITRLSHHIFFGNLCMILGIIGMKFIKELKINLNIHKVFVKEFKINLWEGKYITCYEAIKVYNRESR